MRASAVAPAARSGPAGLLVAGDADQQVLGGDVVVAALLGQLLGAGQHPVGGAAELRRGRRRARGRRERPDFPINAGRQRGPVHPQQVQQGQGDALLLAQQGQQEVRGLHGGVARDRRGARRRAQRLGAPGGEVGVHQRRLWGR